MRATRITGSLGALALATALGLSAGSSPATGQVYVDQGRNWTPAARADFYTRDQGSRVIPYAWARALRTAGGEPFLGDGLARYGYLRNPANPFGLPVGFFAAGTPGREDLSMNCSACHTRQIAVAGREYRVDGGPALTDFQAFLADLDAAVGRVLADDTSFNAFAASVLGRGATPDRVAALRRDVAYWYNREHTLIAGALPEKPWGLGRLDAVSMIFNRVTALDIGPAPTYLIPENVRRADAPVRYPFLWNAPIQDRTQWPGFAKNGNDLLGLARNLGQVYGVFGVYRPRRAGGHIDFLTDNSAVWKGLDRIEELLKKMGPPKYPWPIDQRLAAEGQKIFNWTTAQGGCVQCHGVRSGPIRLPFNRTWATPIQDVGTDSRQYSILKRDAKAGVLVGAKPPFGHPVQPTDTAFNLLGVSVIGSIFQHIFGHSIFKIDAVPETRRMSFVQRELLEMYAPAAVQGTEGEFRYESRVLQGIWAAAPYLHNGSVPTLAELLKPGQERVEKFKLGRNYDINAVGLARDQGDSRYEIDTTCKERNSGNSRCGHEFGTRLSEAQKRALLEYLKSI